jgi:hypothetical protein
MHEIVTLAVAGVYKTTARTTRYTSGLISSYCHISQRELMLGFGGGVKMTNRAGYDKWQQPLRDTYQNEIHDRKCLPLSIIFSVTAIAPVRTESQAKSKSRPNSIFSPEGSRQTSRRNQIRGNFIPWKNRTLKLLGMS